jgi:SAM-dependent methyltransferase
MTSEEQNVDASCINFKLEQNVVRIKNDGFEWRDPQLEYCGKKTIIPEDEMLEQFSEHSWEDVPWDVAREELAKEVLKTDTTVLPPQLQKKFKAETAAQWERFYRHNKNNFFKNRHYLDYEFPELREGSIRLNSGQQPTVLEMGCGVGNSLFPLMANNPDKFFYAFDLSPTAIEILKKNPQFDERRCKVFLCDIVNEDLPDDIRDNKLDIVVSIFCLSAIPPEHMPCVLRKIYSCLKPGGCFLVRDYGLYDMTQMRFFAKKGCRLGENFYVRGDGTFTFYFSREYAESLMKNVGFEVVENTYVTRVLTNRKRKLKMYRVWLRGKYKKLPNTQNHLNNNNNRELEV